MTKLFLCSDFRFRVNFNRLFPPLHTSRALISIGDGHAVQGDGELGCPPRRRGNPGKPCFIRVAAAYVLPNFQDRTRRRDWRNASPEALAVNGSPRATEQTRSHGKSLRAILRVRSLLRRGSWILRCRLPGCKRPSLSRQWSANVADCQAAQG
jgi:hypothetical protein